MLQVPGWVGASVEVLVLWYLSLEKDLLFGALMKGAASVLEVVSRSWTQMVE